MSTHAGTTTQINEKPRQQQQGQRAREVTGANVQAVIEQLEQGHSASLTAYLTAMPQFHNYSFGMRLFTGPTSTDS